MFLLGEDAEGPAAMFRDHEYGARQRRSGGGWPTAGDDRTVATPAELETAVLHALTALPRPGTAVGPFAFFRGGAGAAA